MNCEATSKDISFFMQPNITFFGEKLTDKFEKLLLVDREDVDLLLVMGTSLKVRYPKPLCHFLSRLF